MTKDEALTMALEALENISDGEVSLDAQYTAITAIREALAQPEQVQEPEAWRWKHGDSCWQLEDKQPRSPTAQPLYTTPPKRPWVGLTYEDMVKLQKDLYNAKGESVLPTTFAMAVEAKLKEKNT